MMTDAKFSAADADEFDSLMRSPANNLQDLAAKLAALAEIADHSDLPGATAAPWLGAMAADAARLAATDARIAA